LLAASLKQFLRCDYELIAAVPTPAEEWGELTDTGRTVLEEMDIRIVPIVNEFGTSRPIANKISCMLVPTGADKLVFLDSDVLCLREFYDEERFAIPFNATPSGVQTREAWEPAYHEAGASMPRIRQPAMVSREVDLPYFSSGFVGINTDVPLGRVWLECHRALVEADSVRNTRYEEQVSLAVVLHKLELAYDCLDERYNYPLRHKPVDEHSPPYFCHYGTRPVLQHQAPLEEVVGSLVRERPALLEVMAADEHWAPLARHYGQRRRRRQSKANAEPADLVITGIASSGTSCLSELLDGYSNCVVSTEPGDRVDKGLQMPVPGPVGVFYRLERIRILDEAVTGEGLVEGEDFVLATTHTHSYLSRLEGLRRVLPHARIIACVRNPFDTIAAWKACTDGHDVDEMLDSPLAPKPDDPWLTGSQRDTISQLRGTAGPAQVRATVWQHFAELILNQSDRLTLVRYDDLARDPERALSEVLRGLNPGAPASPPRPPIMGSDRSDLDGADEQAIRAICSQAAFDLGVWS
jgi:sulfotransferase family protein